MTEAETRMCELFEELVPAEGKADTVAGEIVRAINWIAYRNGNDGDRIGVGYGKETCNPPARYLQTVGSVTMRKLISDMWGMWSERLYDAAMETLIVETLKYIDGHPELKTTANDQDMWDYRIPSEDEDCWDDEDEDCDEEEDY